MAKSTRVRAHREPADATPKPVDVPSMASDDLEGLAVPSGAEDDQPVEDVKPDPDREPLPREYVVLVGNASYGPVTINGARTTVVKNKLYCVPNAEERADILGTGRFRAAVQADLARAGSPSAGVGGAITRDLLPPGAVKGGLIKP